MVLNIINIIAIIVIPIFAVLIGQCYKTEAKREKIK